ncbi:hypothetical protein VU12_09125 [Desulfobulbus sp. US4]|nr:hypothetical protein [Desulfobulbus sp. US4]
MVKKWIKINYTTESLSVKPFLSRSCPMFKAIYSKSFVPSRLPYVFTEYMQTCSKSARTRTARAKKRNVFKQNISTLTLQKRLVTEPYNVLSVVPREPEEQQNCFFCTTVFDCNKCFYTIYRNLIQNIILPFVKMSTRNERTQASSMAVFINTEPMTVLRTKKGENLI